MVSEQLERETKYDAAADYVLPPLDGLDADGDRVRVETTRLDSVHFDTADHDLLTQRHHVAVPNGDADNAWQLKVPPADARTGAVLDQAKGILMERRKLTEDQPSPS